VRVDWFDGMTEVPEAQREIDVALANWAAWLRPSGGRAEVSAMFRQAQSTARARAQYTVAARITADAQSARAMEEAVRRLPSECHAVLKWFYVTGGSPYKAARLIGIQPEFLVSSLRNARVRVAPLYETELARKWVGVSA
jgi:hypothetical protein